MTESCRQQKEKCSCGVQPRGAHVVVTLGRSLKPLSSTKTRVRPWRRAFFKGRPRLLFPVGDGGLVALEGPSLRLLHAPTQGPKHPPQMAGMQPHPASALQHAGDTGQRPQLVEEAVGLRTLFERPAQLLLVRGRQLGRLAQGAALPRPAGLGLAPRRPLAHGCRSDPQAPRHLGLRDRLPEQTHAFPSPLLQRSKVPLGLVFHPIQDATRY